MRPTDTMMPRAACLQAHVPSRQLTAAKQNAMCNGSGNPVPEQEPTRRNISYKWTVTEKFVRCDNCSARLIRTHVGDLIMSIPTLYHKETVNHLVCKFIRSHPVIPTPCDTLSIRDMAIKAWSFREDEYDAIREMLLETQQVQPLPEQPGLCQF